MVTTLNVSQCNTLLIYKDTANIDQYQSRHTMTEIQSDEVALFRYYIKPMEIELQVLSKHNSEMKQEIHDLKCEIVKIRNLTAGLSHRIDAKERKDLITQNREKDEKIRQLTILLNQVNGQSRKNK